MKVLLKEKNQIEKEFGHELEWDEIPGKRACRIRHKISSESAIEGDIDKIQNEMIEQMLTFDKVFRKRIRELEN